VAGLKEQTPSSLAWSEVLDLLDKYQLSADDVMAIAEVLYDMAQDYLEEDTLKKSDANLSNPSRAISIKSSARNPAFDRFPLFKQRWGLDPSLIYEDN